jgi:ATP-dependent helicase/nuclease subunit A
MARALSEPHEPHQSDESAEALLDRTTAAQLTASDPDISAWVGANAGAGKTHVLKMRVLRLLLGGVKPERILCLTYTKAAAAEMAGRVFKELAQWATAPTETLANELDKVLGKTPAPDDMITARQLFAKAIETPGGLKVQTIHAFCERLLQRFPLEAGVPPGFEILDEATARALMRAAIDKTLGEANQAPGSALGAAARHAIAYAADDQFDKVLDGALRRREWVAALTRDRAGEDGEAAQSDVEQAYLEAFSLSAHDTVAALEAARGDVLRPDECQVAADLLQASDKKTDQALGAALGKAHRARTAAQWRAALNAVFLTQGGTVKADRGFVTKGVREEAPGIAEGLLDAKHKFAELTDKLQRRRIVDATVALVTLAERVLHHYDAQKAQRAALDFDDLIQRSAGLLERSGASAWVLYKLDGGLDHVLVDEAQDTSPVQWRVIRELVGEFFAGEGRREAEDEPDVRTIFAVGDEKQSIYSFQGAAPEMFAAAGRTFSERAAAVMRRFEPVPLTLSFRTTAPLLKAVDHVFSDPSRTPGLTSAAVSVRHLVLRQGAAGLFELWDREPVEDVEPVPAFEPLEETSASSPVRRLAERIADEVADWFARGERLASEDRPIRASDILVLVRKRTPFAPEMVRAFKRRGIAVAGADRIVLGEHIAVQDLMSVADFLLLPEDDLALANILKSPLFGLDDDDLMAFAPSRPGLLWSALLKAADGDERFRPAAEQLKRWRSQADFSPPFEFFANLLDRDGGRARLIGRLGADAGDAIDEFMNLALNYDEQAPPSLQGFQTWLGESRREIKRDMEHGRDEVRVMTVHGSKGLEAPIVFLPDTCSRAASGRAEALAALTDGGINPDGGDAFAWAVSGSSKSPPIAAARQHENDLAQQEHNRLLYVAMTRARDRLYVGGFDNKTKSGMAEGSWYDTIEKGLEGVLVDGQDTAGRRVRRLASPQTVPAKDSGHDVTAQIAARALPDWASRPAPREANLTVPIAPSRIEPAPSDDEGEWPSLSELRDQLRPPLEPAMPSPLVLSREQSIHRGTLTHALLEHLPELPRDTWQAAATRFLDVRGEELGQAVREDISAKVLMVLQDPQFAEAFGPKSRAEVSIAAVIPAPDGKAPALKVNGQIDRLVRTETGVLIIDFKSNRRPPPTAEAAPLSYLMQLAAYRMVVQRIYEGSGIGLENIETAFLWTDAATLMPVPGDLLNGVQTRLWKVSH